MKIYIDIDKTVWTLLKPSEFYDNLLIGNNLGGYFYTTISDTKYYCYHRIGYIIAFLYKQSEINSYSIEQLEETNEKEIKRVFILFFRRKKIEKLKEKING